MEFPCTGNKDGTLTFGAYGRAKFKDFLRDHGPLRMHVVATVPESGKLRRFFEGALIPLITHYQEGMDHRNPEDRAKVREWLKEEFNAELVSVAGIVHRVAKSTKGSEVLASYVERVLDWMVENYDPPKEAIDPEHYKQWRDAIFPSGGPDNHIDYLIEIGLLK
jgi:hypothetical protein